VSAYRTCNDMVALCCGMCDNVDVYGLCYDLVVSACGICNEWVCYLQRYGGVCAVVYAMM